MKNCDWFCHHLRVIVPSSNWLPGIPSHGDNLQSAICRVISVRHHFPLPLCPFGVFPHSPADNVKMQYARNTTQSAISRTLSFLTTCMSLNRDEVLCVSVCVGGGPPVKGIIGRDRWPPLQPTCDHTRFEHSLSVSVMDVVACSSSSLILSLRAAGERYICATFTCDVSTEIEVMEPAFEQTIQLSDIPG